jgi:plastocyanin
MVAAAAVLIGGASLVSGGETKVSAAKELHAVAGGGEAGIAVNVFSPASIAVSVGDTVTWTNPYTEPHSVAFIAPGGSIDDEVAPINAAAAANFDGTQTFSSGLYASAGMFAGSGDEFSVTFKATGQFEFHCTIHPGMVVDVTVVNSGFTPPIDQDRVEARIQKGIDLGLAAAAAIKVPDPVTGADGKKTWTVPTPPVVPYEEFVVDVLRFTPAELNIGVGDTVVWENDSFTPHTVTFIPGPPPAGFSPFVPMGVTSAYSPGQFLNSGLYGAVPDWIGETFSLSFPVAGTYQYICALHADSGMVGIINVGSGGGSITPPNTGDAGLMGQSSGSWMMVIGLAMLLSSFAAGTLVVVRRNA